MNGWTLTVAALLGLPLRAPPDIPGHLHQCADAPLTEAELAEAVAAGCTPAEFAALAGCSRPTAAARLRAMKGRGAATPGGIDPARQT